MLKTPLKSPFFAICALQQSTRSLMIEEDSGDFKHRGMFLFQTFETESVRAESQIQYV
jgi:hypothetical protein